MTSASATQARLELKVAIVEDDPRFRASLETLLSHTEGLRLAGSFTSPLPLLDEAERTSAPGSTRPAWDLVLMDLKLPSMSGIDATRQLKRLQPEIPVVVLTVFEDPFTILDAICAGADGYLLKRTRVRDLLDQLRAIAQGGAPLTPRVARTLLELMRARTPAGAAARGVGPGVVELALTERERDVLRCLVEGRSYKEVAAELSISAETVRSHIKSIYRKLQVHSVAAAVSRAIRDQLT
jgi:DNA-binding NarL/FixJ family response regulator